MNPTTRSYDISFFAGPYGPPGQTVTFLIYLTGKTLPGRAPHADVPTSYMQATISQALQRTDYFSAGTEWRSAGLGVFAVVVVLPGLKIVASCGHPLAKNASPFLNNYL